jgi:hypothetical protein
MDSLFTILFLLFRAWGVGSSNSTVSISEFVLSSFQLKGITGSDLLANLISTSICKAICLANHYFPRLFR